MWRWSLLRSLSVSRSVVMRGKSRPDDCDHAAAAGPGSSQALTASEVFRSHKQVVRLRRDPYGWRAAKGSRPRRSFPKPRREGLACGSAPFLVLTCDDGAHGLEADYGKV